MLTGKVPRNFGPNRNKHFNDIMETAPILIRQRDPTVPELIALLIDRALDDTMTKPGGLAFQSASEFRDAFITALEQSSITVAVP
jgi:hypothetical protein